MELKEVIKKLQAANPNSVFAVGNNGTVLGSWSDALGRYVQFAANTMIHDPGTWYSMPEVLVNGQRLAIEWVPVESEEMANA